jgi:hypothetical protein
VSNGCCIGLFGWEIPAVKKEPTAHQYHRKARECEMNAEKTTNAADRHAWQGLAEDWLKLARAAEVNPLMDVDGSRL